MNLRARFYDDIKSRCVTDYLSIAIGDFTSVVDIGDRHGTRARAMLDHALATVARNSLMAWFSLSFEKSMPAPIEYHTA